MSLPFAVTAAATSGERVSAPNVAPVAEMPETVMVVVVSSGTPTTMLTTDLASRDRPARGLSLMVVDAGVTVYDVSVSVYWTFGPVARHAFIVARVADPPVTVNDCVPDRPPDGTTRL